ncbi:MAG: hypothetical protein ACHP7N_16630 [Caulobacterales bacterium]
MANYDYLFLELSPGAAVRAEFIRSLAAAPRAPQDGRPLGVFVPQLGWAGSQAAVLIERAGDGESPAARAVAQASQAVACERWTLVPTVRPRPGDSLSAGGIYVHRWFEVESAAVDEFVALSGEAWPDFEGQFDARIFGLFTATPAGEATTAGLVRLLLITRYASHGVWEDSRDPTTSAMQTFARRAALTRRTQAASTLLALL